MTSGLYQMPRKETHDFHRTNAEKSGILFGVAADGHCLFPAGMQVDRAARRVEASASDQLIRHARALSGLRPAPPPFVYFVVRPPRRICRAFAGIREEGDMV